MPLPHLILGGEMVGKRLLETCFHDASAFGQLTYHKSTKQVKIAKEPAHGIQDARSRPKDRAIVVDAGGGEDAKRDLGCAQ